MSDGLWEMKYKPIPLERINRTICSTFFWNAGDMSSKSKCASSKKKTNLGLSKSPTSGIVSYSSDIIHKRNVEYNSGAVDNFTESNTLIIPFPSSLHCMKSDNSNAGSPKKMSPPCSSRVSNDLIKVVADFLATAPYWFS